MVEDAIDDLLAPAPTNASTSAVKRKPRKPQKPVRPPEKSDAPRLCQSITLEVLADDPQSDSFPIRQITFRIDMHTCRNLRRLHAVLVEDRCLLNNGRNVQSIADAARYLLEQFLDQEPYREE